MRESDLAWCAGIVDGEGCISIGRYYPNSKQHNKAPVYRPSLVVNMTHKPTIERLASLLECGSISKHSECRLTRKQAWIWAVKDRKADAVLRVLEPYLFTKRAEARMVIGYYGLGSGTRYTGVSQELLAAREALFMSVRAAKSIEWPA